MELNNISIKSAIAGIVFIILIGVGILEYFGKDQQENLAKGVQRIIEQALEKKFKDIDERISLNTEFRIDEYVKLIEKNAKKIRIDPTDVKKVDILLCISYLNKIPEERKTEYLKAQIRTIIKWAEDNP